MSRALARRLTRLEQYASRVRWYVRYKLTGSHRCPHS
jgi:hypothetical protein